MLPVALFCHVFASRTFGDLTLTILRDILVPSEPGRVKEMAALLEAEDVAYDIGAYRDAPPGLRCGALLCHFFIIVLAFLLFCRSFVALPLYRAWLRTRVEMTCDRIWCGATVEASDVAALMPWLKWAFDEVA